MKKQSKKIMLLALTISAVLLIGFVALVINNYKTKTSLKYASQKIEELKPEQHEQDAVNAEVNKAAAEEKADVARPAAEFGKLMDGDFVLGEESAPIVMIEYASLSCPHCAAFNREAFDKLKDEYISTGKVKFVFRHFPLNQAALTAAMFVDCQTKDHENSTDKYFSTIKSLFKTQDSWAFDPKYDEKLETIAKLDGMSSERFHSCVKDAKLQERILSNRIEVAKSLQVRSVPTFIVGGQVSEGYVDYVSLKKMIEEKLAAPASKAAKSSSKSAK